MSDKDDEQKGKDNILIMPGAPPPNLSADQMKKMIEAGQRLMEQMPALIDFFKISAKLTRAKFDALKKEGFNDQQALELCRILF